MHILWSLHKLDLTPPHSFHLNPEKDYPTLLSSDLNKHQPSTGDILSQAICGNDLSVPLDALQTSQPTSGDNIPTSLQPPKLKKYKLTTTATLDYIDSLDWEGFIYWVSFINKPFVVLFIVSPLQVIKTKWN